MSWEMVKLIEICRPKQWKTLSMGSLAKSGYPVYGANGKIGYYNRYTHEFPTLMVTCRGATCGSVNISEPKSYINGNAMAFDNLSGDFDRQFLYYFFLQRGFNDVISGSAQPQITGQGLSKILVPKAAPEIQKRISSILNKADALRKKDQRLLLKYDQLLESVFYHMFGDPMQNKNGWISCELKTLFNSNPRIGTIKPVSEFGSIPIVRVGELGELDINIEKCKKVSLPPKEKERYLLKKNDILLARAIGSINHLGKASLVRGVDNEIVFDSHVMRLQFNQGKLNSLFFYNWLQSSGGRNIFLSNSGKTSVQFNINSEQISRIKINLPPTELQNHFASIAENIQQQRKKIKQQIELSQSLFQSLLQKAFKGELVN